MTETMNSDYHLSRDQLLADLRQAFFDARRHKRDKPYVQSFERRLDHNLQQLADDLWNRTYQPEPSTCFVISEPKKREVFAARFRDRVVHHLCYNYIHEMLERTFIADSYSCIKRRGTHYGIRRLEKFIRSESQNWTERCHVLKLDIRGYFININRQRLLDICLERIVKMSGHRIGKCDRRKWREVVDLDFVRYIVGVIILLDPTDGCHLACRPSDWDGLPREKSLFHAPGGCGLPIGNLTSQLFSNVYLSVFDDYMKRELHCTKYGRYVDDAYVVCVDRERLLSIRDKARDFLLRRLGLRLHEGKSVIVDCSKGVEFLGAFVKPHRTYISRSSLKRMRRRMDEREAACRRGAVDGRHLEASLNSFLGVLSHYCSYRLRRAMFVKPAFVRMGLYDARVLLFSPVLLNDEC